MSFRVQGVYNRSNVNSFPMHSAAKLLLPLLLAPAFLSGPAHAEIICSAVSLSSCNVTENRVKFSNFSFSPTFTPNAGDTFSLIGNANAGAIVTLNFNPQRNLAAVGASFTYTATLLPTSFFKYTFNTASSSTSAPFVNDPASFVTTSLTSPQLPLSPTRSQTGGTPSASNQFSPFQPNLTTQTFTQTFIIDALSGDVVALVQGSWTAKANPVPGPLPLLGAATAFGLSRKLRRRIRSAG
jgi:hypothetical protein